MYVCNLIGLGKDGLRSAGKHVFFVDTLFGWQGFLGSSREETREFAGRLLAVVTCTMSAHVFTEVTRDLSSFLTDGVSKKALPLIFWVVTPETSLFLSSPPSPSPNFLRSPQFARGRKTKTQRMPVFIEAKRLLRRLARLKTLQCAGCFSGENPSPVQKMHN